MLETIRNRDCIILAKGDFFTANVNAATAVSGWKGGQGFQYTAPVGDELLVKLSDGLYAGFALWGSDEPPDEYTSMTRNQPAYNFVVLGAGGGVLLTTTYEKYTYASRIGPGPLVPIQYNASDRLVFSSRGYWTKEDEWTLSGDPRAPNNYYLGFVAQVPTPAREGYMTIQYSV
jgi:hypothetical protein